VAKIHTSFEFRNTLDRDGSESHHIAEIEVCENIKSALSDSINEFDMHFLLFSR